MHRGLGSILACAKGCRSHSTTGTCPSHVPGMAMPPPHPLAVSVPHPQAWQCQPHVAGHQQAAPGAECPETTAQQARGVVPGQG